MQKALKIVVWVLLKSAETFILNREITISIDSLDFGSRGRYAGKPWGKNLHNWECSSQAFLLDEFPKYHFEMLPLRHPRVDEVSGKARCKLERANFYHLPSPSLNNGSKFVPEVYTLNLVLEFSTKTGDK